MPVFRDWSYKVKTMFYFVRHLAGQALMSCQMHGLVSVDSFLSSSHTSDRENFPNLQVLSRKEKMLFISPFKKFISLTLGGVTGENN